MLAQAEYAPCGCKAILSPGDPRARIWKAALGCLEFPLKGPVPVRGQGPGEDPARFLRGDWEALSMDQQIKIRAEMKRIYHASSSEFDQQIKSLGFFPIKDENINVLICGLHTRCML